MVDIAEWIESNPITEVINTDDGEEVLLYTEEGEYLQIEHRISYTDFVQIFGPVIRNADDIDAISADDFLSAFNSPSVEEDSEFAGEELGYEEVIRYWVDNNVISA
jgi:hypothetical protein